jgi:hypothetical protein
MLEPHPTPLEKMQSAIQLAGFHYIVCMKALPTNADYHLSIERVDYVFDAIRAISSTVLHSEFQRWSALVVLRDLIESFSTYLMEVYGLAIEANSVAASSVTLAQFERKGIEDQLAVLSGCFTIDSAWIVRLVGYNKARNCLAHRQGLVGPRDITDGNDLVVRWLVSKIELTNGLAGSSVSVDGPMNSLVRAQHIQGAPARAEVRDKEKRIPLGSVIRFMPTDILEICQTFQLAAAAFSTLSVPR